MGTSFRHKRALNAKHFNQPSVNRTVKMKNLLLTVLAFGLLSSSAFGEEQPRQEGLETKQFNRVVASGAKQRIGFFYAVHPDCTASGDVNIRVTKQPEHGSTETTTAMNSQASQKKTSAPSAMTIRFVECKSIINRQRNTPATMSLTCSFSSPPEPLGKFITT